LIEYRALLTEYRALLTEHRCLFAKNLTSGQLAFNWRLLQHPLFKGIWGSIDRIQGSFDRIHGSFDRIPVVNWPSELASSAACHSFIALILDDSIEGLLCVCVCVCVCV